MIDRLDRDLADLAEVTYHEPTDADALLACLAEDEQRRARRVRLLLLPALLVLSAGLGYAAARFSGSIPTQLEMTIDGGERFDAGTYELNLDADGRPRPIQVPVEGQGTVELQLELPEGADPATLQGMRFLVEVSTDPHPEQPSSDERGEDE